MTDFRAVFLEELTRVAPDIEPSMSAMTTISRTIWTLTRWMS
jgi:hypothetical protein